MTPQHPLKTGEEEVLMHFTKHWMLISRQLILSLLMMLASAGVIFLSSVFMPTAELLGNILFFFGLSIFLMIYHWLFTKIAKWKLSGSVVTTKRVIDFKASPFFKNDVIYVNINEVHEIERVKTGIFPNMLDYGTAQLNLAAVRKKVSITYVPQPEQFVDLIEAIRAERPDKVLKSKKVITILLKRYRNNLEKVLKQ